MKRREDRQQQQQKHKKKTCRARLLYLQSIKQIASHTAAVRLLSETLHVLESAVRRAVVGPSLATPKGYWCVVFHRLARYVVLPPLALNDRRQDRRAVVRQAGSRSGRRRSRRCQAKFR